MANINIYIDGNNLYRSAKGLGFDIDYRKFGVWLRQKYNSKYIYLFIGLIQNKANFYSHLKECGFTLIFKQTISVDGIVKGNCDAELVLKTVSDFYIKEYEACLLITGDGDFGCLIEFLREKDAFKGLIAPDVKRCSFLLKNKNVEIFFLNKHYYKFSKIIDT